jgi:four helix bundle protein
MRDHDDVAVTEFAHLLRMTISFHPAVRNYRDLIVWQKGVALAVEAYRFAERLPRWEQYGLKSQILRASVSVPSNIAEGHGRHSRGDYVRHLSYSRGSLSELDTLLYVASEVGHTSHSDANTAYVLLDEIGRMLWAMMTNLGKKPFYF